MSTVGVGLPPGTDIDGYKVVRVLGDGGFGIVHLVEKSGKRYALKLTRHREASGDEKQTHARTLRELAILVMLEEQPHIVHSCGHGYWPEKGNGYLYLVLEYVEGWTLGEWMERTHATFQELLRAGVKLAAALNAMHGRGMLHRDVKWPNVLMRKSDGEPVLIDFGCASHAFAQDLTEEGLPPGTDRFRAPEQFSYLRQHREELRARYAYQVADELFAFGAMLYELLTDPRPTDERPRSLLNSLRLPPPPARELNPRVPQALSDLVDSLLARDPARRPVDTAALLRELEELAAHTGPEYAQTIHLPSTQRLPLPAGEQVPATPEPPPSPPRASWLAWARARLRSPRALAVGGLVASAMAVGLTVALWPEQRPAPRPAPASAAVVAPTPAPLQASPERSPPPAAGMSLPNPEKGSTVTIQKQEAPKPARPARSQKTPPSPAVCKAMAYAVAIAAGCTGFKPRPEPFDCPNRVWRVMTEQLGWKYRDRFMVLMDDRYERREVVTVRPGQEVVSIARGGVMFDDHDEKMPAGTQFFGTVYVDPENGEQGRPALITVKYDRVKLPGHTETLPVCVLGINISVQTLNKDGSVTASNLMEAGVRDFYPEWDYWRDPK